MIYGKEGFEIKPNVTKCTLSHKGETIDYVDFEMVPEAKELGEQVVKFMQ